jgi:hypothetical protein
MDLSGITNIVFTVAGAALMLILIVRMLSAWTRRAYGEMAVEVLAVIIIGIFVWFPAQATNLLKGISDGLVGGPEAAEFHDTPTLLLGVEQLAA